MNNLEITGKLVEKLEEQNGTSSNGAWRKTQFIMETAEQYPKKVCVMLWGDKVDDLKKYEIGPTVKAFINVESREFNGRWYTDIKAWRLDRGDDSAASTSNNNANAGQASNNAPSQVDESFITPSTEDDLPF